MIPLAEAVPDAAVALYSKEFWGLVILVLSGTGGAVVAVGKWLATHISEIQKSNAALINSLQSDKVAQRDEFLRALDKREVAFAMILERRDSAFTEALVKIEDECGRQRELDRRQREEDRNALLRAIGIASGGDTGRFVDPSRADPRPSRGARTARPSDEGQVERE